MIRAVIDANVFVSATLIEGTPPAQIIDAWQDGKFELITSASIINVILSEAKNQRVIYYPKVRRRSPYSEEEIEELLMLLERKSTRTPEELKLEIVLYHQNVEPETLSAHMKKTSDTLKRGGNSQCHKIQAFEIFNSKGLSIPKNHFQKDFLKHWKI